MPRFLKSFTSGHLSRQPLPMPKAGESIYIIPRLSKREQSVILPTRLWEIRKGHLLLLQTTPQLTSKFINKNFQFSYIITLNDNTPARVGFNAPLLSIVELPQNRGQIIVVLAPKVVTPLSLRVHSRVVPAPDMKLSSSLQLEGLSLPMELGDISLGGVRLLHKGGLPLPDGQRLRLAISHSHEALLLPATLMRQEKMPEVKQTSLILRFVDLTSEEVQHLKNVLNQIWKHRRSLDLSQAAQKTLDERWTLDNQDKK